MFREWRRRLDGALAHLPQPLRRLRVDRAVIGVITDVARWEGGRRRRGVGRSEMIADLLAWTSAGLLAAAPGRGPATTGVTVGVAPNVDTLYSLAWLDLDTFQLAHANTECDLALGRRTHGSQLPPEPAG